MCAIVFRLPEHNVQYSPHYRWNLGVCAIGYCVQGKSFYYQCLVPSDLTLINKANFQNTYLGGILIAVAFLNAFIEFYQLQKSEAILASFLAMIPPSCRVVRDGSITTIAAAELVKGDVVLLVCPYFFPVVASTCLTDSCYLACWGQDAC